MTFEIKADKLVGKGVKYIPTQNKSGKLTPVFGVIHYTAGVNFEADVSILSKSGTGVSCHLVLGPKGELAQIGSFIDSLWHVGKSAHRGYVGLNRYAIGIEVTCPGPLSGKQGDKEALPWRGKAVKDGAPWPIIWAQHDQEPKPQNWARFTETQETLLLELCPLLTNKYGLKEWVGHDDVDVPDRRKRDPGPSCPQILFDKINGNKQDEPEVERPDLPSTNELYRVVGVAPDTLTFRASPRMGADIGKLVEGQLVEKIATDENWMQVRTPGGFVGWAYMPFLEPVSTQ